MSDIILIDRSRIEARQGCPRLRYLNYHLGGTGIQRVAASLSLLDGIALHDALAEITAGKPLEQVLERTRAAYLDEVNRRGLFNHDDDTLQFVVKEQLFMLECLLRMWQTHRLPRILEEYQVVAIEEPQRWEICPGLQLNLRFDVVLRRKDDGLLHLLDYKSVGYAGEDWLKKWEYSEQWVAYLAAAEEIYKEPFGGVLVEGFVKGQYRKDTAKSSPYFGRKIQNSPLCYGYKLPGDHPIYQTAYTSKKGWVKCGAFDEMTPQEWVSQVLEPAGFAQELFIVVPPLCPSPRERERWKRQTIHEELVFHHNLAEFEACQDMSMKRDLIDISFPMRRNHCFLYGVENSCQMLDVCYNETVEEDPLGSGLYEPREPHHNEEAV